MAGSSHDGALRPRLVAVQPARPVVGDLRAAGPGCLDDHRLDRQPLPPRGDAASPPRSDRQAAAGHSGAAGHRGHPGRAAALHRRVGGRPGGLRFRSGHRLLPRLGAGDPRPEFASPIRQQVVCGDRCAGVQRRLPARAASQHRRSGLRRAGRLPLRAVSWVCRGPNCAGRGLGRRPAGRGYRARGPRRRVAGAGRAGIALATNVGGYELEVSSPQRASGRVVSVHDREVHLRRVRHRERHPSAAADAAGGGPAWPWPVPAAGRYPRDAAQRHLRAGRATAGAQRAGVGAGVAQGHAHVSAQLRRQPRCAARGRRSCRVHPPRDDRPRRGQRRGVSAGFNGQSAARRSGTASRRLFRPPRSLRRRVPSRPGARSP